MCVMAACHYINAKKPDRCLFMLSIHNVFFATFLATACLFPQAAYSIVLEKKQDVMPTEESFKKATEGEVKFVISEAVAYAADNAVEKAVG